MRLLLIALFLLGACAQHPGPADFARHEASLRAQGKMRSDTVPADAPFGPRDLAANFHRIAFFETGADDRPVIKPLTRWETPIRWKLIGTGATAADRREVTDLMRRTRTLTGLATAPDDQQPNFMIFILDRTEQSAFARDLARRHGSATARTFEQMADFAWDCSVHAFNRDREEGRITMVAVFIRAEVRGFYRRACLHEEIFQGLGLFNDDNSVRPSIFNDDEEFALLTAHDELLLRILYDRRLSAGMTAERAMPTVPLIVRELLAG